MTNLLDSHPTKIPYSNTKMNRWKSWRANTMFAPSFDIPIYVDQYDQQLSNEIVDLIKGNDVGMSSDVANSLCTTYQKQWSMYNIFNWQSDAIKKLSDKIYETYVSYMKILQSQPIEKDKLWIRGWAVVLIENESLSTHCHAFHENTYLSGNLSLSDLGTTTDYWFPHLSLYFDWWRCENKIGSLTLFPSWLEHRVEPNNSGKLRYSVGFDLFTEHTFKYIEDNRKETAENQNVILLSKRMSEI